MKIQYTGTVESFRFYSQQTGAQPMCISMINLFHNGVDTKISSRFMGRSSLGCC